MICIAWTLAKREKRIPKKVSGQGYQKLAWKIQEFGYPLWAVGSPPFVKPGNILNLINNPLTLFLNLHIILKFLFNHFRSTNTRTH